MEQYASSKYLPQNLSEKLDFDMVEEFAGQKTSEQDDEIFLTK